MKHEIKPILSSKEYAYKRKQVFKNEEYDNLLYWIVNEVMRGKI